MNEVVKDLDFIFVYIDDILVASKTKEEHKSHLGQLFKHLNSFGLNIKTNKCIFGVSELDFLNHKKLLMVFYPHKIKSTLSNIAAVEQSYKNLIIIHGSL